MIFTIGKKEWYDQWIVEQGPLFKKRGKDDEYSGGSAFLCIGKAIKNCPPGYAIYILDTNIDNLYEVNGNLHIIESCRICLI
ncbi:MAG: hypothetical protein M0R77_17615 [Gammaproteobacteria bacterium]|nr:hypothetical protein [Gammaproteobacteria bacterium]